jgi:hypothetical protein
VQLRDIGRRGMVIPLDEVVTKIQNPWGVRRRPSPVDVVKAEIYVLHWHPATSKGLRYPWSRGGCHTRIQGALLGRGRLIYINRSCSRDPASNLIAYSSGRDGVRCIAADDGSVEELGLKNLHDTYQECHSIDNRCEYNLCGLTRD